jgi:hypothetical protein
MSPQVFKQWENQLKKILGINFNPINDSIELLFFEYEKSNKKSPHSEDILKVIKDLQKIQVWSAAN